MEGNCVLSISQFLKDLVLFFNWVFHNIHPLVALQLFSLYCVYCLHENLYDSSYIFGALILNQGFNLKHSDVKIII